MEISSVIKAEYVLTDLKSTHRDDVLKEMIAAAYKTGNVSSGDGLLGDVLAREASFTTKIMEKIAIPHAKSASVSEAMVFVGKSKGGVVWDANPAADCPPEDKVYLIYLILVPDVSEGNEHLKLLATLARCLSHEAFRGAVLECDDPAEIIRITEGKMQEIAAR